MAEPAQVAVLPTMLLAGMVVQAVVLLGAQTVALEILHQHHHRRDLMVGTHLRLLYLHMQMLVVLLVAVVLVLSAEILLLLLEPQELVVQEAHHLSLDRQ